MQHAYANGLKSQFEDIYKESCFERMEIEKFAEFIKGHDKEFE